MTYEILIGALGFIGALAVVIRPLIALNTNIAQLTASVDQLKDVLEELKTRVSDHGKEIDEMRVEIANHEARISALEK